MKKAIAVFVVCCVMAAFADNPHITMLAELVDVALSSPSDGDLLAFNASTGKWNNKPQPVTDSAKVVLRYKQESIFGTFPETALFNPSESGNYRVNIIAVTPQYASSDPCAGALGGGNVIVSYNDGTTVIQPGVASFNSGGVQAEESKLIKATAGSPITIRANSGCQYSFDVVVEKL